MTSEIPTSLEKIELQVKNTTITNKRHELTLIENLLKRYLDGFRILSSKTGELPPLEFAWLLLVVRGFISLRCAYDLLQKGYYSQAVILIRAAEEDYLTCRYCEVDGSAVDALLSGKGKLGTGKFTFTNMAKAISEDFYKNWQVNYGQLSEIAHPRQLGMAMIVDWKANKFNLGADYNENHFVATCHALLRSAVGMTEFLINLLGKNALQWQKETYPVFQAACAYVERISEEVKSPAEKKE